MNPISSPATVMNSMCTRYLFNEGVKAGMGPSLRPIIDKTMGRWLISINPLITMAFDGPEAGTGLHFEPEMMICYAIMPEQLSIDLDYYTALGPFHEFLPVREQVHLLYPKIDYTVSKSFSINAGVGIGVSDASDPFTLAARFSFLF